MENGLSNNAVICSVQDRAGFMWFGTKDGLNRFDGYSFKIFRNNPDDTGSIGSNFIHALYEDEAGTLWIGTEKGLYQYNALAEHFSRVKAAADYQISEITADKRGNLWFISGLTLHRYTEKTGQLTVYNPYDYFESTGICTTPDGRVWVSTSHGLLKNWNPENNTFSSVDVFSHSGPASSKWIEKLQSTADGNILVGTGSTGLKIFDTKRLLYKDVTIQQGKKTDLFVRSFLQTGPDEFWIGTESGIFIYNQSTGRTVNLCKKYNDPFSLSDNAVYTFCRDKEGGIWSGTYFGGINYYPQQYTSFKKFFPKIGENSLSGNVVREIRKDADGNLWIGTEDAGLNKLDDRTGLFTHFGPDGSRNSLSYSNIHGLLPIGNELWVGTFEHGLDVMNRKTGKVVRHYGVGPNSAFKSNFIYSIYQASSGEILVGTTIGIFMYNRVRDAFDPLPTLPVYNWYTAIVKDTKGTIWTGTYGNGVHYYHTETGSSGNFRYTAADKNSISSDRVNAIYEASDQNLWFATEDGLCRWNPDHRNFTRYGTADGFPSNFMLSILEDAGGRLWISTSKGLVCFSPVTKEVQVFTTANGLLSDQFNFNSAYKDHNGQMYFGSAKGLVSFRPEAFSQNNFTPPVYITGFQVNNRDMVVATKGSPLKNAITFTTGITLTHDQATFSIDFAALSYTAPEMVEYTYQLEGLSNEWTYLKTNRKVYFTELEPGDYVFKVKASTGSGLWKGEERTLAITILPPWWKSWWAYSLYGLAVLAFAVYLIRNYHRRMQEKAARNLELLELAKEKELYEAKMEFFTHVAHEIRTPLTLIKGPLEKVFRKAGHLPELQTSLKIMERNTARLIELTSQLLDFRQTEINGFGLSFVQTNISELLDDVSQGFATLAEQKGLLFSVTLPPSPLLAFVDAEAFTKIIYNLCSNTVKYAGSAVQVKLLPFEKSNTTFTIKIKNDGYLIPETLGEKIFEPFYRIPKTEKQKGTGIGLALSRSLTQLHRGLLQLEKPEDGMNVFTLTLPVHQEIEFTFTTKTKPSHTV